MLHHGGDGGGGSKEPTSASLLLVAFGFGSSSLALESASYTCLRILENSAFCGACTHTRKWSWVLRKRPILSPVLTLLLKGGRSFPSKEQKKKRWAPGYILSPEQFNLQFDPKAKLWLVLLLTLFKIIKWFFCSSYSFFIWYTPSASNYKSFQKSWRVKVQDNNIYDTN